MDGIEICRWKNGKKGAVTLTFDDGYKDTMINAVSTLNSHGMRGTFAIPLTNFGNSFANLECSSWSDWMKVKEMGHELSSHGVTHRRLNALSDKELENELKKPAEELNATTLAYPHGAYDSKTKLYAKRYYLSARTVWAGFNSPTDIDMFALKSYNCFTNPPYPPLIFMNLRAKYAEIRGLWLIETYHLISDHPSNYPYLGWVSPQTFNSHLNYLGRLNVWVDTLENVSKYILERKNTKIANAKVTKESVKLELCYNLDPRVFNIPLSLKIKGRLYNVNLGKAPGPGKLIFALQT